MNDDDDDANTAKLCGLGRNTASHHSVVYIIYGKALVAIFRLSSFGPLSSYLFTFVHLYCAHKHDSIILVPLFACVNFESLEKSGFLFVCAVFPRCVTRTVVSFAY